MRKNIILATISLLCSSVGFAQLNAPARIGQYGFTQLMVNSWGQTSGWGNAGAATVGGVESFFWNVAGLGKTRGTELAFSRTSWLVGTGININSFGFAQSVGDGKGAVGMSVNSFSLGQIPITTTEQPDGGIGTYKPSVSNINLGYAYNWSGGISAGLNVKLASESTPDVRTSALAFDAGLQYATKLGKNVKFLNEEANPAAGRESDIYFGVSIKNLGTDVRYSGDGLAAKSTVNGSYTSTTSQRSDKTALPSFINIAMAYDIRLDNKADQYHHRLTMGTSFTSHVATSNQTSLGFEYSFKEMLMLRGGYNYEKGIFNYDTRNNAYTGLNLGATVQIPFKGKDSKGKTANAGRIAVDYSFRQTNPFSGTHTFGVRVGLD